MKKITILFFLCVCSLLIFAQKYENKAIIYPQKVWTFDGSTLPEGIQLLEQLIPKNKKQKEAELPMKNYAQKLMSFILRDTIYKQNFLISLAEVPDVVAVMEGEQRYILLSPTFASNILIEEKGDSRAKLAHLVAYHVIKGISFKSVKEQVLTADLFAANIIGKMEDMNPEAYLANIPDYKVGNYPKKEERSKNLQEKAAFIYTTDVQKADSIAAADSARAAARIIAAARIGTVSVNTTTAGDSLLDELVAATNAVDTTESIRNVPEFQTRAESYAKTYVKWWEEEYAFGEIKEGDIVTHKFTFQNMGTNDLYITHVKPSCGCTATDWSKEAIKPNETGYVEIKFDSHNKAGSVTKTVTIFGNFEGITKQIIFTGEVKESKRKRK
jgi:hypothetical protein